jgi:hypothetical protein
MDFQITQDALYPQTAFLHRPQVLAPSDEANVVSSRRQPGSKIPADGARTHDRNSHAGEILSFCAQLCQTNAPAQRLARGLDGGFQASY